MKIDPNYKNLYHTTYLDLNESTYQDNHGKSRKWVWAQRPYDQQAVMIAATLGDTLVIIKEYRVPVGGYIYELPAGLIDLDEDPITAGKREFEEETGFRISELIRPISPPVYNSPGLTDESIFLMFGRATIPHIMENKREASEDIEVLLYSRASVQDLMYDRDVKIGAKAYLIFQHFVTYGDI